MLARLEPILDWFATLSQRERVLVTLAVIAVIWQLASMLVLEPQQAELGKLRQEMAVDATAMQGLATELRLQTSRASHNPNVALRERIEAMRGRIAAQERQLELATDELISPREMARFLEQLLNADEALVLLNLRTLDPQPLLAAERADGQAPDEHDERSMLHRHGFEIAFSGGYLATLRYLDALQSLPWQFFWDSVSFDVIDYPNSVVRLQLYTLSLSEDWIGV
jgi:MSHA biogenesis protein MshJ